MISTGRCAPFQILQHGRTLTPNVLAVWFWLWAAFLVDVGLARAQVLEFSDQNIKWFPTPPQSTTTIDCAAPNNSERWLGMNVDGGEGFDVHTCNCGANMTVPFQGSTFELITGRDIDENKVVFILDGIRPNFTFEVRAIDGMDAGVFAFPNLDPGSHVVGVRFECNQTLANPMTFRQINVAAPDRPQAGVIAGAVVGAAVGSFFLTVFVWLLFRRYTRRNKLFPFNEPPENRIDPLDISRYTKPSGRLSRSSTRPGTSTFSRLYSLRIRDGRPHFRAPPSYNPPSTVETTCSAIASVSTPACPPIAKALSRSSHRTSSPPPRRATHPPSIREAYEVTPFVFTQQEGAQKDVAVQDMSSVSPPLHVQTQLELHAKRRGSYPMEKVMDEPPFEVPSILPAVPKRTVKLDDEPRPTVGQRRAFFVANQSSKSSLRSSGVPVPSSHLPPQTDSDKPQDADAEYVVNSSRKWEKSRALPRIDDEDVPDNSRPNADLEAQAPPKPVAKKSGMRVFFTTNPSSISSSSISSRSLSQARRYIKRKRRRQDESAVANPSTSITEERSSTPPSKQHTQVTDPPNNTIRNAPVPTRGVIIDAPVSLHVVTPRSPNNTLLDLNDSTGGIPSTVSAGLSDSDFDIDSSAGHPARRSLSPPVSGARLRPVPGRQKRLSKTVFYATNPSTISEPSIISAEVEVSSEGQEEVKAVREEMLLSPLSEISSIPRPRLDKGKAKALY